MISHFQQPDIRPATLLDSIILTAGYKVILSAFHRLKHLKPLNFEAISPHSVKMRIKKPPINDERLYCRMVETVGIEPATSCMPCKRSPS